MRTLHTLQLSLLAALLAGLTFTATAHADELADLKARFQSREPAVQSLKTTGQVGETFQGYLDLPPNVTLDNAAKALMADENTDRKRLYTLIATKEGVTPEVVADRNAKRNFGRAASGVWLKFPDGTWQKKA